MIRFDASRSDFAPYGLTCERWTPSPMRRPDRHNEVELNLLQGGSLTYLLGGRKVTIRSGRLAAFWAAIPHQIIEWHGRRSDYFVATIPLAWFLQCDLPDRLVQPILHAHVVCDPDHGARGARSEATADLELFQRWVLDLERPTEQRRRVVLLEMQARLLRLAMALPPNDQTPRPRPGKCAPVQQDGLSKAEQMACFIAQHYIEPLSVDDISRSVGLHPNYAMSLFRRLFGATLTDYLAQHRVSHAQRLLATTNDRIVDVAMRSGFNSISRFNDVFRKACGCSPRQYRQSHRLAVPA